MSAIGSLGVLWLAVVALVPAPAAEDGQSPPVKIAVFEFELEDVSAAGSSATGESARDSARLKDVTSEARQVLAQSGRYSLIDVSKVDAKPVTEKSLRQLRRVRDRYRVAARRRTVPYWSCDKESPRRTTTC